jgi:cell division protein FtsQ
VAVIRNAVEDLPWVYRATVQRVWPDRLRVDIEEQVPVAYWGEGGFLNRFGESFHPEWIPAGIELPQLSGPQGHEQSVLDKYRLVVRTLAPLGLRVARLQLDERRAWRIQTGNGVQLELGRAAAYERLQRFVRSYPAVFAGRLEQLQRVDLRYSNGFSVYWQQAETDADTDTARTDKARG